MIKQEKSIFPGKTPFQDLSKKPIFSRLDNGIQFCFQHIPDRVSTIGGCIVKLGSAEETPNTLGYSHFLEHMMFKGTPNRSAKEISAEIDRRGGFLNANTSHELTTYYFQLLNEDLQVGVEVLCDMIFSSKLDSSDISTEKNVVLEERLSTLVDHEQKLLETFYANFLKRSPYGKSILGTPKSIRSITKSSLAKFYKNYYHPENLFLVFVGGSTFGEIQKKANETFGKISFSPISKTMAEKNTDLNFGIYQMKSEDIQVHFCFGFKGFAFADSRSMHFHFLCYLVGGSTSSRLFLKIREELGLCYQIDASPVQYKELGITTLNCATSKKHFLKTLKQIKKELDEISQNGFTESEMELARQGMLSGMKLEVDSMMSSFSDMISNYYYNIELSREEKMKLIQNITLEEMNALFREIFDWNQFHLTYSGMTKKEKVSKIFS